MLYSKILQSYSRITHGFSTKKDTDLFFLKKSYQAEQIHGSNIKKVTDKNIQNVLNVDGLITARKNINLCVRSADCVPILIFDPTKNYIAAIHAGWKGTYKQILKKTIKMLKRSGSKTAHINIVIGPSIGFCCYDIPKSRATAFNKKWKNIAKKKDENWYIDLKKINMMQSRAAGVRMKNIEIIDQCTYCDIDLFYSFRRDKTTKKLQYSYIGLK